MQRVDNFTRPELVFPIPLTPDEHNALVLEIVSDTTVHAFYAWYDPNKRTHVTDESTFCVITTNEARERIGKHQVITISFPHRLIHPDGTPDRHRIAVFVEKFLALENIS